MTGAIAARCWNHETREAVCRCPECGRSFCRECVTEHETRLLCAVCLAKCAAGAKKRGGGWRRLAPAGMLLTAILMAWFYYFAVGQTVITLVDRAERMSWQR